MTRRTRVVAGPNALKKIKNRATARRQVWTSDQWLNVRWTGFSKAAADWKPVDEAKPNWLSQGWRLDDWPAVDTDLAWREWFDYAVAQLESGSEFGAALEKTDRGYVHGKIELEHALLAVCHLNAFGRTRLSTAKAKPKLEKLPPVQALRAIRQRLFRRKPRGEKRPTTGASEQGEGAGKSRAEILKSLPDCVRQAYMAYQFAETMNGKRLEDREAYDHIKENGLPDNAGDLGELSDYMLPVFDTWARYVRDARLALGEQKYNRKGRPPIGRSIVKADEVERRDDNE